jgi:hypothetical protein
MPNETRGNCPVCGYNDLLEPSHDDTWAGSFEICPCCGTQFGYDDATRAHDDLRKVWLASGAPWWSEERQPPFGWNALEQLRKAGLTAPSENLVAS